MKHVGRNSARFFLRHDSAKIPTKKGLFAVTRHPKKCYRRSAFIAGVSPFRYFFRSHFFMAANTKKPPTKSEIYAKIVDDTGLTRKDVAAVFESLNGQIKKNLGGRGAPGMFTVPGLLKMRVVKKPARKARKGVNPFTGEEMMFKAKPATKVVEVSALKGLKDMV
jgi:nucleoid DNA-binding protein